MRFYTVSEEEEKKGGGKYHQVAIVEKEESWLWYGRWNTTIRIRSHSIRWQPLNSLPCQKRTTTTTSIHWPLSFFLSLSIYINLAIFGATGELWGWNATANRCSSFAIDWEFDSVHSTTGLPLPPLFSRFAISIVVPSLYNIEDASLYVRMKRNKREPFYDSVWIQ